jgi:hypothetical protein
MEDLISNNITMKAATVTDSQNVYAKILLKDLSRMLLKSHDAKKIRRINNYLKLFNVLTLRQYKSIRHLATSYRVKGNNSLEFILD